MPRTTVSVDKDALQELRDATYSLHGTYHGKLQEEASTAMRERAVKLRAEKTKRKGAAK